MFALCQTHDREGHPGRGVLHEVSESLRLLGAAVAPRPVSRPRAQLQVELLREDNRL